MKLPIMYVPSYNYILALKANAEQKIYRYNLSLQHQLILGSLCWIMLVSNPTYFEYLKATR